MAAIIQPQTHHHGASTLRASRPPRHLSTVTLPLGDGPASRTVPGALGVQDPLFSPAAVAATVAAVLVAVILALGVGSGAFSALVPTPGSAPISAAQGRVVVVEAGDSVWSIARSIQPDGDVRALVHRIVQANGAAPLQPGQQIVVPV